MLTERQSGRAARINLTLKFPIYRSSYEEATVAPVNDLLGVVAEFPQVVIEDSSKRTVATFRLSLITEDDRKTRGSRRRP